jgi:hypothetical protein
MLLHSRHRESDSQWMRPSEMRSHIHLTDKLPLLAAGAGRANRLMNADTTHWAMGRRAKATRAGGAR